MNGCKSRTFSRVLESQKIGGLTHLLWFVLGCSLGSLLASPLGMLRQRKGGAGEEVEAAGRALDGWDDFMETIPLELREGHQACWLATQLYILKYVEQ